MNKSEEVNTTLFDEMKGYERVSRYFLERKKPVIIRLDGRAFHTFTRGLKKPFDSILAKTMQETMLKLCARIEGTIIGYTQSDEISLLLGDWRQETTQPFFANNIQKITSVAASMCTLYFSQYFRSNMQDAYDRGEIDDCDVEKYRKKIEDGATFDCRCFNLPDNEEVLKYFIWRQKDCIRNSIQATAQSMFSHKELNNKNCDEQVAMMIRDKDFYWEDKISETNKYGTVAERCKKQMEVTNRKTNERIEVERNIWQCCGYTPIFSENRTYISNRITEWEKEN